MDKLKQILSYLKGYKKSTGLNVLFNAFASVFSMFTFGALAPFLQILFKIDTNLNRESENYLDQINVWLADNIEVWGHEKALLYCCLFVSGTSLIKNIFQYLAMYNLAVIRNGVVRDLRNSIYNKLVVLPLAYYSKEKKGNILSKATNDVAEIEWSVIGSLEMLFKAPINILVYLGTLFYMSWMLTLASILLLAISAFIITRIGKKLKGAAKKGQSKLGELMAQIDETLTGIRIIKAFNAERNRKETFEKKNEEFHNIMVKLFRRQYLASPISEFLGITTITLILFIGGNMVLANSFVLTGPFFIVYLLVASQLIAPAKSFSDAFFKLEKGSASIERLNEILDAENPIKEIENAHVKNDFNDKIRFDKINFSYDNAPVLQDVSFEIKKGETVALVGPSGGGKSTIAALIPRFYDVQTGTISIDGISIKDWEIKALRGLIGIVSQQSILFNDSVANNIAFGDDNPNMERVKRACQIANASEFVEQLENTYNENIGEGGDNLSGGQKQRISIARAIYKNPPLLILDEATSALDTESEKLVQNALDNLMKDRTSVVIAHRLSTIQNADKILVIEKGRIAEMGTHTELISQNGLYKRLTDLQAFE